MAVVAVLTWTLFASHPLMAVVIPLDMTLFAFLLIYRKIRS